MTDKKNVRQPVDPPGEAKGVTPRRGKPGISGRGSQANQAADQIGNRLRKIYNDVVEEPIPDDFKALLEQLDDKEGSSS